MQGKGTHIVIQSSELQRALIALDTVIAFSAFELNTHLVFLPDALTIIEDVGVQEKLAVINTLDTSTLWLAANAKGAQEPQPGYDHQRFFPNELATMLSNADQVLSF